MQLAQQQMGVKGSAMPQMRTANSGGEEQYHHGKPQNYVQPSFAALIPDNSHPMQQSVDQQTSMQQQMSEPQMAKQMQAMHSQHSGAMRGREEPDQRTYNGGHRPIGPTGMQQWQQQMPGAVGGRQWMTYPTPGAGLDTHPPGLLQTHPQHPYNQPNVVTVTAHPMMHDSQQNHGDLLQTSAAWSQQQPQKAAKQGGKRKRELAVAPADQQQPLQQEPICQPVVAAAPQTENLTIASQAAAAPKAEQHFSESFVQQEESAKLAVVPNNSSINALVIQDDVPLPAAGDGDIVFRRRRPDNTPFAFASSTVKTVSTDLEGPVLTAPKAPQESGGVNKQSEATPAQAAPADSEQVEVAARMAAPHRAPSRAASFQTSTSTVGGIVGGPSILRPRRSENGPVAEPSQKVIIKMAETGKTVVKSPVQRGAVPPSQPPAFDYGIGPAEVQQNTTGMGNNGEGYNGEDYTGMSGKSYPPDPDVLNPESYGPRSSNLVVQINGLILYYRSFPKRVDFSETWRTGMNKGEKIVESLTRWLPLLGVEEAYRDKLLGDMLKIIQGLWDGSAVMYPRTTKRRRER